MEATLNDQAERIRRFCEDYRDPEEVDPERRENIKAKIQELIKHGFTFPEPWMRVTK